MATAKSRQRLELESDYRTWATICLEKHGHPWPISEDDVAQATDQELSMEIKKLRTLGRTPHE